MDRRLKNCTPKPIHFVYAGMLIVGTTIAINYFNRTGNVPVGEYTFANSTTERLKIIEETCDPTSKEACIIKYKDHYYYTIGCTKNTQGPCVIIGAANLSGLQELNYIKTRVKNESKIKVD